MNSNTKSLNLKPVKYTANTISVSRMLNDISHSPVSLLNLLVWFLVEGFAWRTHSGSCT